MENRYSKARRLALASTVSVLALGAGAALAQEPAADATPANTTNTATNADNARWSAHGSLTARAGTERHIGELDLFVPLWQSDSAMLYGDLRAQTDDAGNQEGNVGLGFRRMGEDWIVGGYGFFDSRKSDETGNSFMQGTLGVEALTETLDLRANVYLPESDEQVAPTATEFFILGGSLGMRAGFERALPGVDGEVGYRLWGSEDGGREVRAFAGGYYFDAAEYSTVAGARGRIEARLFDIEALGAGSRLTFGAEVTQDSVRDTQGFAIARLTIPFGGGRRSGQGGLDRRMTDYVVRDVDIVTAAAGTGAAEAVTFVGLFGNVTMLTAADDIVATTAGGAIDDVFIVDGSAGTFDTTATIALRDGQALLGAGADFAVVGAISGTQATYVGARPTINGAVAGGAVIALATNARVFDLDIENTSSGVNNSYGIAGTTVTGAWVRGNSITTAMTSPGTTFYGYGVSLSGGGQNTITNNSIATNGTFGHGVSLDGSATNFISNNSIVTNGAGHGVSLTGGASANSVSGNNITTNGSNGYGIFLDNASDTAIAGNSITTNESGGHGIHIIGTSVRNNVSYNDITTNGTYGTGVVLDGVTGNIVVRNDIVTNGGNAAGIMLANASNANTVSYNAVTTGGDFAFGMYVGDSSSNEFIDNVITTSGLVAHGVLLFAGSDNTFSGNTVMTNGDFSIGMSLGFSYYNTLDGNSITTSGSTAYGVTLNDADFNTINNNVIATGSADAAGIYLVQSGSVVVDSNTGIGNSYSGPASPCTVDASLTGTNTIDLCQ